MMPLREFVSSSFKIAFNESIADRTVVLCSATENTPVLYASDNIFVHTGYLPEEIIGGSLKILQGPETSLDAIALFRYLIRNDQKGHVELLNYKKDGTPFFNKVSFAPIIDGNGLCTHYIALQVPSEDF